ncbi:MAG: hypothetical protein ACYS9X_30405 [Planctomycetota bacterium]|jgi:hypothetical protein
MVLRALLHKLQLWASYDNTSALKKRYMLLAGVVLWPPLFLAVLAQLHPAFSDNIPSSIYISVLGACLCSGIQIVVAHLCRLVMIANLYASMLLCGVAISLYSNLSSIAGGTLRFSFLFVLLNDVLFCGFMLAFAWLSLKLNSVFRREPKAEPANPGEERAADD